MQERNRWGRAKFPAAGRSHKRPQEELHQNSSQKPTLTSLKALFSSRTQLPFWLITQDLRQPPTPLLFIPLTTEVPSACTPVSISLFPFSSALTTEALGLSSPCWGAGVAVRWGDLPEEPAKAQAGGKGQKPRGCPPTPHPSAMQLEGFCCPCAGWAGWRDRGPQKIREGDKLNHRVKQRPSRKRQGAS